jgi:short subunit dehydrogenase-like uncharacterized protein
MIPWGDVSTAHHTTGIPNIEVYIPASSGRIAGLRSMDRWRPLLKTRLVQWWLKRRIGRGAPGPAADQRDTTPMHVWGEARNAKGTIRTARLRTANGYTVTVEASLGIVEHLLKNGAPAGYHTPSQIVGADFVGRLHGSTPITLAPS